MLGIVVGIVLVVTGGIALADGLPTATNVAQAQNTPLVTVSPSPAMMLICGNCMWGADFGDRLKSKNLTNSYLPGISINANGADTQADFTGTIFDQSILNNAMVRFSNFTQGSFQAAKMDDADFDSNNLTSANFTSASIKSANFSSNDFTNANLTGADLENTTLNNNTFAHTNFTNANFSSSSSQNNTFTNVIWNNTTCADGSNSNNNQNTCSGHMGGQ